ncbi:SDR family NAD(P)-dependent oxidoreductase [Patulibacter minatonensis]|uniref:SDR family NAD(P)-dependent oxidoreductase n=1 Tax=Patulibacter minatonensis TaxID=298163 RepID=UPI00047ACFE6|nr:SDR family NAD(P)-dependent oxidoreductase [Patulibacter minatonensis]
MGQHLTGTAALVTGASSGIGEATALSLAVEGAAVALVARRGDRLEALAERIRGAGARAQVIVADVTDREQAVGAVERAAEEFGRLDTVINNAGVMLLGPIEGAPLREWERMLSLNVQGLMYVAHAALPHLLKAGASDPRGVADLVNVSSVAGRVARSGSAVYNATKHAVGAFSEGLRQEVTERHVRVSLVEPGAVATELSDHLSDAAKERFSTRFAEVEMLRADDIADAISYLVTRPRHVAINEILIRPTEQVG